MESIDSMAPEIQSWMSRIFTNCNMAAQYYPDARAWKFQLSFNTDRTASYTINPPKGCCLMKVQQLGRVVLFDITLFVEDFVSFHCQTIAN